MPRENASILETRAAAVRTRPLVSDVAAQGLPIGLVVRALVPTARFSLRIRASSQSAAAVGGVQLDQPINRFVQAGERWSARLGPDEWLIGGADVDTDVIQHQVETALDNCAHALVDVSHRNVAFEISGLQAAFALNAGCPLDLHDTAFPAGSATRTLLGKAEVVLIRPTQEPTYRVECWRSFATYVNGFLVEAVHGLGMAA